MKKVLLEMKKELESRQKSQVLLDSIDMKLNRSTDFYMEDLKKTCEYLVSRNAMCMLRAIDKHILEEEKK